MEKVGRRDDTLYKDEKNWQKMRRKYDKIERKLG